MICGNCGAENADFAAFCEVCGMKLEKITVVEGDYTEIPPGENSREPYFGREETGSAAGGMRTAKRFSSEESFHETDEEKDAGGFYYEEEPQYAEGEVMDEPKKKAEKQGRYGSAIVMNAAKEALGSAYMLIATVLVCLQVIAMLMFAFSYEAYSAVSFVEFFVYIASVNTVVLIRIGACVIAVIEILLIIGFLQAFSAARKKGAEFRTSGLTILQVLCAAGLIIASLGTLCYLGLAAVSAKYFMAVSALYDGEITKGEIALYAGLCVLVLAVLIAAVIFFERLTVTVGRAKKAAAFGDIKKNISLYAAVILIVIAVCIIAFAAASLFTLLPSGNFLLTAELLLAAACVLYALFIINYRKKMKEVL